MKWIGMAALLISSICMAQSVDLASRSGSVHWHFSGTDKRRESSQDRSVWEYSSRRSETVRHALLGARCGEPHPGQQKQFLSI